MNRTIDAAIDNAYHVAMEKLAYSGEKEERQIAARALYDKLMADDTAEAIDSEIADRYRARRRLGTLAALAAVPTTLYGLHLGTIAPSSQRAVRLALTGTALGTAGLVGRGIYNDKLKQYYGDRDYRKYKNVGNRLADTSDYRNLAAHDMLKKEWRALQAARKAEEAGE